MRGRDTTKRVRALVVGHWSLGIAAAAGFLLSLQTIWILRPGTLGGIPWPLATIGVSASDVVLVVAAAVGILRGWRAGRRRMLIAGVMLVVLAAVNIRISVDPELSAVGWARIIAFLFALVGIPSWSHDARRAFLGGFLIAMFGHVLLGLLQFTTGHGFASTLLGTASHDALTLGDSVITAPGERWLRAYGGFPHPNILGTALLVAMVALVRRPVQSFIIHYSLFIILVSALVPTFSRAALLGLIVLLIVLAVRNETRRLAMAGTLALIAALAVTASFWAPRITGSTPNEQRSLSERTNSIRDAVTVLPTMLVSPGHGLHALPVWMYERYGSPNPKFFQRHPEFFQPVHNVPLLVLIELGGIGILVLALILFLLFRNSSFIIHHSSFSLALLPTLLFDHHLWSLPVGLALLFVLAIAVHRPASSVDDAGAELHTRSVRVPSQ